MIDADTLLATTRAVRRRLDLTRPVERHLLEECIALAQQAPSGGNRQIWSFVVVTDPDRRAALAELYRRGWERYVTEGIVEKPVRATDPEARARQKRITASARYLADHLHEVPALVVPCITHRTDGRDVVVQASQFGSVLPAVWSFMLAARARDLGTAWTTIHLFHEREAAEVLGIPFDEVMQVALIPVAHLVGEGMRPGHRRPLDEVVHWDRWGG
ncbi:MAG: nitroreductase family protein [Thermoleophilia bacterium]